MVLDLRKGGCANKLAQPLVIQQLVQILLLDEPFEGVAPVLAKRLIEVIRNLKNVGISIILTESDLTHSKELLDSICMIDRGEIIPPKQLW